jgi:hypothetical protein
VKRIFDVNREELINRKEAVRAEIAQVRHELARATREQPGSARAVHNAGRRAADLEARLQALAAEEHRLRLLIDRTR